MPNANKDKGDRAERAVRDLLVEAGLPKVKKTRAGFDDDMGDIVVTDPADRHRRAILQVKDVATPQWSKWHEQVASQIEVAEAEHGVIVHKRRRSPGCSGQVQEWNVVMTLAQYVELLALLGYRGGEREEQSHG